MGWTMFNALVLHKAPDFQATLHQVDDAFLPEGDVTVDVEYSTLNYKDGLAITNRAPVVRSWPMVPGIDAAGVIRQSDHPSWKAGDRVVLNGWGVGETHKGGLAQRARLRGDWLVRLPEAFTAREAMAIGTAGYTAMLCAMAVHEHGVRPGDGEVLVTGATGGVGSIAVLLLAQRGYRVTAATGRTGEAAYLRDIGAHSVIGRDELALPGKPLQKERWSAVVDCVGSHTLANACAQTRYGGVVAACGLAQGGDLPGSVMPFILRSVTLRGIDSVMAPLPLRERAWALLAEELAPKRLDSIASEVPLAGAIQAARRLMDGSVRGRVLVRTRE
jgi:acrylyl-CoA reductase (NADPH)